MQKREIKFRAWDKKHNCWDDDFAIHADGCLYQPAKARWDISDIAVETAYDELEIMQFTGLKDKNGKEIYEGDIVSCADVIVAVTWKDAGFHIITNESQGASMFVQDRAKHFEVIGNIYSNPELL
jgi:uncharacterized phage protein (TIGR01671 family)